ncbi:uncharacterized protein B0I36DRAFT_353984 [Microdochium trichocladiopsis]|uniref:DUF967 domain protein n=1 Tax=Microdochium trichocladiopsis TaxID=1682393 RepID=A0A9P9BL46_9PEZI|nr:uncharacterized protein B0I36DRAFT_353984 [Microdochium trichocladiopsis]KAH7021312.1 hypothetical protein B0I36DRAFT_353984 [Microdochium trichocladiopsis]
MAQVLRRRNPSPDVALKAVLAAQNQTEAQAITSPPDTTEQVLETCNALTFTRFTAQDAYDLGQLLYARLLPLSRKGKPTVISIAAANTEQILFQAAVGSGTLPDNELWVRRKRASVLRWGCSTWLLQCKYAGDEEAFRAKFGMSQEQAGRYAIHGGGVPIRVDGVEGVVAVVVVSGLKQHEDHGVIFDVVKEHWESV